MYQRSTVVRPSVALTVVACLTISQFGMSSARALEYKDDYLSAARDVSKRNSWWSKKSMEPATDYQRIAQESVYDDNIMEAAADRDSHPAYSSLFRCYVRECVPTFVQCAQRSTTQDDYSDCKKRHELCSVVCGSVSAQETLI